MNRIKKKLNYILYSDWTESVDYSSITIFFGIYGQKEGKKASIIKL